MTPILIAASAYAETFSFPTSVEHVGSFYPTAYVDHGGVDWDCQSLTSAGHLGSDFGAGGFPAMDDGRTITAAAAGTVVATNDGEIDRCETGTCAGGAGFGNYVQIEHEDGRTTLYAHLAQFSIEVAVGDVVKCGQVVGRMGSSGFSTGPHVHFEVRDAAGVVVDPFNGACSAAPSSWTDQAAYGEIPSLGCSVSECSPLASIGCGAVIDGTTDVAGAASETWEYGCSEWTYSGPELSWTFETPLDEPVTVTLDQLTADLDVYVLSSERCDGTGCLGASTATEVDPETLTFEATADTPYTIVVDGWEGAAGPFRLEVACEGVPREPPDTGTPPTDTGGSGVDPPPPDPDAPAAGDGTSDCGACATGGQGSAPWLAPVWLALVRRRWTCGTLGHDPRPRRRVFHPRADA